MKNLRFSFVALILIITFAIPFGIVSTTKIDSAINLSTALNVAQAEALKWDLNAKPYFVTSVESNENNVSSGEDGRRNTWNFDFAVESTCKHLIIYVRNGKVARTFETESYVDNKKLIDVNQLKITSEDAIDKARNESNLLPGTDWIRGYHFVMEKTDEQTTLTVVGVNKKEELHRIKYNATQKLKINTPISRQRAKKILDNKNVVYDSPRPPLLKFTGQEVTCYVSTVGRKTASGKTPEIGYVAVHPSQWGNHLQPIIYFGETIVTETILFAPNTNGLYIFNVQDIGEVYNENNRTKYWFDIYIGLDTPDNIKLGWIWGTKYNVTFSMMTWNGYTDRDA